MDVFSQLPPFLEFSDGKAFLTLATWDNGWQAAYIGETGYAERGYHTYGRSIHEAALNMKETIDLVRLLEAPSGEVEEAVRPSKTMGEETSDK